MARRSHTAKKEKISEASTSIAAGKSNSSFIITAKTAEGDTKKYRVKAQSPNMAKEKFSQHHSMAKILDVSEEGVAEGSEKTIWVKPSSNHTLIVVKSSSPDIEAGEEYDEGDLNNYANNFGYEIKDQGVAEAKGKRTYTPEPMGYGVFPDNKNEFVKTFLSKELALDHVKKFGGKLIVIDQQGRRMKLDMAEGLSDVVKGIKRVVKGKPSPDEVRKKYFNKALDKWEYGPKDQQDKAWDKYERIGKITNPDFFKEQGVAKGQKTMKQVSEGYYPMGKQGSYSDAVPTTKIIIQHSRKIEEGEQRYRNIAKIFVENTQGERFAVPTIKPGIARVYARHIAEGGTPYDERGKHITSLVEEYSKMAGFVRATKGKQFNESAQQLVNEGINHYQSLRESLRKMTGHRGYMAYFESYTPTLVEDGEEQPNLNELFVQETLDPRIESVMPILSKLHKKVSEMREVGALAEWADSLTEMDAAPVEESGLQAYLGNKKYGKEGMDALRKAGREHAGKEKMAKIRAKYDNLDEELEEDLDADQKRVGQLGPTEKVGPEGAVGKLVGTSESIELSEMDSQDDLAAILRIIKK
jgi:hypothetical protein